jgi:hypothetical protein
MMPLAKLLLAGLAFASTPAQSAVAGATNVWIDRANGDLISLAYGPADPTKNPLFMLSCFNEMQVAVLDVHKEVDGGRPGQPLTIEVASAQKQAPLKGEVAKNDATGTTFGEASDIDIAVLLDVLKEPGPLTLKMGAASETLPDEGRAAAVSRFTEGCKLG